MSAHKSTHRQSSKILTRDRHPHERNQIQTSKSTKQVFFHSQLQDATIHHDTLTLIQTPSTIRHPRLLSLRIRNTLGLAVPRPQKPSVGVYICTKTHTMSKEMVSKHPSHACMLPPCASPRKTVARSYVNVHGPNAPVGEPLKPLIE